MTHELGRSIRGKSRSAAGRAIRPLQGRMHGIPARPGRSCSRALQPRVQGPVHRPHAGPAGRGIRGRRAPRRHRRSAGHRRGAYHGRDRGRARREVCRLHRHGRSRILRERAGRLLDLGRLPGAGDARMRGRRYRRPAMGGRAERQGACLRDRRRRHDLHPLHNQPADLSAADRPELQQVLDSIEFEPAG